MTRITVQTNVSGAVPSVFGRTGAIVALTGDYVAAQVTNAANKASSLQQAFTSELSAPDFSPSGLPGASSAGRYVGTTVAGAPTSGTFRLGDWVTDQSGKRYTCTVAGTPGSWTQEPGAGGTGVSSFNGRTGVIIPQSGDYTAAQITGAALLTQAINAQTGTSYTLALSDQGKLITLNNGALVTLTIPTFASVAFPVGAYIDLYCISANGATIAVAGGVTLPTPTGVSGPVQNGWCRLVCIATDQWIALGLNWQDPVNITPPVIS